MKFNKAIRIKLWIWSLCNVYNSSLVGLKKNKTSALVLNFKCLILAKDSYKR